MNVRKKSYYAVIFMICFFLLFSFKAAYASLIGYHESSLAFYSNPGEKLSFLIAYGDGLPDEFDSTIFAPFSSIDLSSPVLGDFIADPFSPEFFGAIGFLTNGINDLISEVILRSDSFSYSTGFGESMLLMGPGFSSPDFQGSIIESMRLSITDYSRVSFGSQYTNTVQYRVEYYSNPVPEPSTILLLGSGLLGLAWYGRKRKMA